MSSQESTSNWNIKRILGCPFWPTIIHEESVSLYIRTQILSRIKKRRTLNFRRGSQNILEFLFGANRALKYDRSQLLKEIERSVSSLLSLVCAFGTRKRGKAHTRARLNLFWVGQIRKYADHRFSTGGLASVSHQHHFHQSVVDIVRHCLYYIRIRSTHWFLRKKLKMSDCDIFCTSMSTFVSPFAKLTVFDGEIWIWSLKKRVW